MPGPYETSPSRHALTLMSLFPPGSGRHLQWGPAATGQQKAVTTAARPATAADYHGHLAAAALDGPGAIGISPARLNDQGRLVCDFVALDLDTLSVETLPTSILDTLEGLGVHGYVNCGSTGRGSHLYIFLEESLPAAEAFPALTGIAHLVREACPNSTTETFPSNPSRYGKGIFLPYRGADKDGFGANPLLHPRAGLTPIALDDALDRIQRTAAESLCAAAQFAPEATRESPSPNSLTAAQPPLDARAMFQNELQRLATHWRPGVRNHLVKGLTAYAASGLAMEESAVLQAITQLHCSSAAPHAEAELTAWFTAARRTLQRHARGEPVAWHTYYEAAGVAPPAPVGSSLALETRRVALQRQATALGFPGSTGLTDRALYEALVELAVQHGSLDARGLAVRVSRRDLASRANLSDNGAKNALRRLRERDLVHIPSHQRLQPGQAGYIALTIEVSANQRTQSTPITSEIHAEQEWVRCFAHTAFRRSSLGGIAGLVVAQLQQGGAAGLTLGVMAKRLERAPWRLRGAIDRLVHYGVIEAFESGGTLRLAADFEARLDVAAERTGAVRARARQKERHEAERAAYRAAYVHRPDRLA